MVCVDSLLLRANNAGAAMSQSGQSALRNELCAIVLAALTAKRVTQVEAVVACMGIAAVVLGTLPQNCREALALEIDGKLLEHANRRAKEIRSGEFDRTVGNA